MEDIHFDRHIVSIDYTEYGNTLTVVLDDGSIVHYDPRNMTPLEGLADPNTVTSLAQAGFHYPPESSSGLKMPCPSRLLDTFVTDSSSSPYCLFPWCLCCRCT